MTKAVVGGATTTYVYDAQGNLAAENSTGSNPDAGTTQYLTADHLGSTRLTSKTVLANGQLTPGVLSRSDYLPFGQEIPATWGGRTNYTPDPSQTVKFTGKERDSETGLDYFGARYFSGAQGRFTSPDWSEEPEPVPYADLTDPQTLNLYSYVRNSPLARNDPTGHCPPCFITPVPDQNTLDLARGYGKGLVNAYLRDKGSPIGAALRTFGVQEQVASNPVEAAGMAAEPYITMGLAMAVPGPKGEAGESVPGEVETPSAPTMKAAQRMGMREESIPTSQQPVSQENTPAGRQYTYEVPAPGGGTQTKIVQRNAGTDRSHPGQPHVEVGSPKRAGQTDSIGRPRLGSNKVKINVKELDEQ